MCMGGQAQSAPAFSISDKKGRMRREKKHRRQKTLKTPFLRRTGESCGKILFRRCNLSRRKKLTNNSGIPQHEIENIARILLPDILAFYESEEGQREFAEWKAARDGAKTDKDSNGENVA